MPKQKYHKNQDNGESINLPLAFFACPNSDCADFNKFDADNLSIAEWMGKDKAIRRLYCKTCGARFSERQGSLMQYTKLPQAAVVRIGIISGWSLVRRRTGNRVETCGIAAG